MPLLPRLSIRDWHRRPLHPSARNSPVALATTILTPHCGALKSNSRPLNRTPDGQCASRKSNPRPPTLSTSVSGQHRPSLERRLYVLYGSHGPHLPPGLYQHVPPKRHKPSSQVDDTLLYGEVASYRFFTLATVTYNPEIGHVISTSYPTSTECAPSVARLARSFCRSVALDST